MKRIEYQHIDKSHWDRGEWDNEPDKIQWQDEATGLPCLIVRNKLGSLCGYVGVSQGHPYFKKEYDSADLSVHGGITFADSCHEDPEHHGICHIPGDGEPDHVWWFGFDCGHAFDVSPGMDADRKLIFPDRTTPSFYNDVTYKNVTYVENEIRDLAKQLKDVGDGV